MGVDAQASEQETKAAMSPARSRSSRSKLITKPGIPEAKPARSALDWVADTSNPICSSFWSTYFILLCFGFGVCCWDFEPAARRRSKSSQDPGTKAAAEPRTTNQEQEDEERRRRRTDGQTGHTVYSLFWFSFSWRFITRQNEK